MALINTTTTGVLGSTFYADGTGDLTIQQNGTTVNKITSAPAFSAYLGSNQTPTNATYTKVNINTIVFDTASCFNTSTYRFTPNVAGYYQIQAACRISASTSASTDVWAIYKNGANFAELNIATSPAQFDNRVVSSLISMNGTTDYVEFYCYISGTGTLTFNSGSNVAWFQGFLARAA